MGSQKQSFLCKFYPVCPSSFLLCSLSMVDDLFCSTWLSTEEEHWTEQCGVEELDREERAGESDKSEPKLLLQTLNSPALKKICKTLSQPCCGICSRASGCRRSSCVCVLSEGAVGTA